jgi:hypothetical protein
MRELQTKDVFKLSRILKKMNLNLAFDGKNQEQLGAEIVMSIATSAYLAETEINDLMADLLGIEPIDFASMPLEKTLEVFIEFSKQPQLASFFKFAARLTK